MEFEIANSISLSFPPDQSPFRRPQAHWIPPSVGTVKINFDGASFKDADCAGIGVIILDELGLVIATLSQNIALPNSVADIEAITGVKALEFAHELLRGKLLLVGKKIISIVNSNYN